MALQLFKIETIKVTSPVTNITFNNIPSGYTDLKILGCVRTVRSGSDSDYLLINFNNSSAAAYEYKTVQGNGSAASSNNGGSGLSGTAIGFDRFPSSTAAANTFGNFELYIPNYTASIYKSISSDAVAENNITATTAVLQGSIWADTSAITSVKFAIGGGTSIDTNSTFTLYGIL
jgi:hypothetical protein